MFKLSKLLDSRVRLYEYNILDAATRWGENAGAGAVSYNSKIEIIILSNLNIFN